jgi:hypothetical protein
MHYHHLGKIGMISISGRQFRFYIRLKAAVRKNLLEQLRVGDLRSFIKMIYSACLWNREIDKIRRRRGPPHYFVFWDSLPLQLTKQTQCSQTQFWSICHLIKTKDVPSHKVPVKILRSHRSYANHTCEGVLL